jgi:hypothetical protein
MFRNKIIILVTILLTACSSLTVYELSEIEKNSLTQKIEELKDSLVTNNLDNIENFFEDGIKERALINQIRKMNLSEVKVFYSEPEFQDNQGKNVVGLSLYDSMLYLDMVYQFKQGQWKVIDVNQKEE